MATINSKRAAVKTGPNIGTGTPGSPGSGSVAVQDEGTQVAARAARLNFTGAGVTATSDGDGGVNVDIPGGGAAAQSVSAETTLSVTTSATAGDATFAVFADTACTELVIDNNTGVDIEAQRGGTGPAVLIPAGQRRRIVGLSNANQIGVRRAAYTDNIARTVTVVARTLTSTQTFTVAGSLSVPISSGGGNTAVGALACTAVEIINMTGKRITWRIGTTAARSEIRHGESVIVRGITNANQINLQPFDSVAQQFLRPVVVIGYSGSTVPQSSLYERPVLHAAQRLHIDSANYPALWETGNYVTLAEQGDTRRTLRPRNQVLLASFPTVAGSTLSQAAACADVTTGEILYGTSAVEYTQSSANAVALFAPAAALAAGVDVTNSDIHIEISLPDNAGVNYGGANLLSALAIELHSAGSPSAATADYHSVSLSSFTAGFIRVDTRAGGAIIKFAVPIGLFASVGTGATLTAITWARFRLTGGGAGAVGCKFRPHSIKAIRKARTKAAVVFLFDDLHIGQYTNALPILARYGYPACLGIDTVAKMGQTGFMTPAQIRTLHQHHGWQAVGQVMGGGASLLTVDTDTGQEYALSQAAQYKLAMKALGVSDTQDFSRGSSAFNSASPGGIAFDNLPVLKRLFRCSVEFLGGNNTTPPWSVPETVPFGDPYFIRRINMSGFTAGTWAQRWQEHLDQAIAHKGVAVYGAHSEFNTAGSEGLTALATFVEYIRTQELAGNVDVLTLAQLIESAY